MRFGACAIGVLAAVVAAAPAASAETASAPPVASLRTLPVPAKLPTDYVREIGRAAEHVGITRATAVRRTRMLLSDVTGLPLYAFGGTKGQVCFVVWRGVGTCGVLDRQHAALWAVNGGSRKRGEAVVGIVSDRVRAVTVLLGERKIPVRVRHNAFVAPFRLGTYQSVPRVTVVAKTR